LKILVVSESGTEANRINCERIRNFLPLLRSILVIYMKSLLKGKSRINCCATWI